MPTLIAMGYPPFQPPTFLPPGKGGLILILGGLCVLGFTVIWLLLNKPPSASTAAIHPSPSTAPRPGRHSQRRTRDAAGSLSASSVHVLRSRGNGQVQQSRPGDRSRGGVPWPTAVQDAAQTLGLGTFRLHHADAKRCTLLLRRSRPPRTGRERVRACKAAAHELEHVVQSSSPGASVVEIACNARRRGTCVFEVRRGDELRR